MLAGGTCGLQVRIDEKFLNAIHTRSCSLKFDKTRGVFLPTKTIILNNYLLHKTENNTRRSKIPSRCIKVRLIISIFTVVLYLFIIHSQAHTARAGPLRRTSTSARPRARPVARTTACTTTEPSGSGTSCSRLKGVYWNPNDPTGCPSV